MGILLIGEALALRVLAYEEPSDARAVIVGVCLALGGFSRSIPWLIGTSANWPTNGRRSRVARDAQAAVAVSLLSVVALVLAVLL